MTEFLFGTWNGGGTTPPVLGIARALLARGHAVRVLADPVLHDEVRAAGAEHVPWTRAPHVTRPGAEHDLIRDWEARTPMGGLARARDAVMTGPAGAFAADVLAEHARRPADVVVAETVLLGVLAGAEAAGIPSAALVTTVNPLPQEGVPAFGPGLPPARGPLGHARDRLLRRIGTGLWDRGLPELNAARAGLGLPPLAHTLDQAARADRVLVLTSAAFDPPGGGLPPHVVTVGPRLDDPAWAGEWTPPAGDAPLVVVGLSSTFQDQERVLGRVAAALGTLPVRGLVTTGPAVAPAAVPAPANVEVVAAVPHAEVLPRAAAVVTHGGHGTTIKALAHGVPVVVLPMGRDQLEVAARVVRAGAGVRVRPGAPARAIAAAVRRVLDEPAHRAGAARVAAAIAAERAEDRAVAELEALAARRAEPVLA